MKFAVLTLLLATLVMANPAPIAEPNAVAQLEAVVAQPEFETLAARIAEPEVDTSKGDIQLEARKSKPKGSSNGNQNNTSAAIALTPSRALELGALGLGVLEIVKLWG